MRDVAPRAGRRGRPVLILGGTAEARALAAELDAAGLRVVSSLAGRVTNPRLPVGEVREGGFGGPEGLAAWLAAEDVAAMVDATHPFAARMTASAVRASRATGVPLLVLRRPGWREEPGDAWHRTGSLEEAAALLQQRVRLRRAGQDRADRPPLRQPVRLPGAGPARADRPSVPLRVFLTTGRRSLPVFSGLDGAWFLARSVDPPEPPVPANVQVLLDRGPYTVEGERALIREHRLDVLVTKDSGGDMTRAKLVAARELGLPVVMVDRPPLPPGVGLVGTAAEAARWARHHAAPGT
ncbi:cobalt-precorrin-6A reductase [Nonomuraea pusilla]|uniref:cobalt-precorrin-6A reductase n=1 Tax=Nonomuraea pusilla TaxID=46177 RepID=UPI003321D867